MIPFCVNDHANIAPGDGLLQQEAKPWSGANLSFSIIWLSIHQMIVYMIVFEENGEIYISAWSTSLLMMYLFIW